jgi:hypothetical protein
VHIYYAETGEPGNGFGEPGNKPGNDTGNENGNEPGNLSETDLGNAEKGEPGNEPGTSQTGEHGNIPGNVVQEEVRAQALLSAACVRLAVVLRDTCTQWFVQLYKYTIIICYCLLISVF